jgi:spermidine synthase
VLVCAPIAYWCLGFNLAVGSLLASALLFLVPLGLLAMTGPFLVRIITSSVTVVGGAVGRLTAIGTLGSFVGTLCIGYVMLPLLPNSVSMFLTAAALALVSGGYFAGFKPRSAAATTGAVAVLITAGFLTGHDPSHRPERARELFRGNSNFGAIQVIERTDGAARVFANDNLAQNTYDPTRKQSLSRFTYALAGLAHAYTTNINAALCIGLGVGIVPMELARDGVQVDVVEINPAVVPIAERYFDFEPGKVRLTIDDGRHFLNRCRQQYDAVVLDAFLGDSSPSHLMTQEAFAAIRRVLRPGGVLVINAFGDLREGHDFLAGSLCQTLQSVFPGVRIHEDDGQVYLVATDHPDPAFLHKPDEEHIHPYVQLQVARVFQNQVALPVGRGRILTDDFNPVEYYDAANRESLRRQLALDARAW